MNSKDLDNYFRCSNCANSKISYNRIDCGSSEQEYIDNFKRLKIAAAKECRGFEKLKVGGYTLIQNSMAYKYILSGNSKFKLKSGKTGAEIYYTVQKRGFTGDCKLSKKSKNYIFTVYAGDNDSNTKVVGSMYFDKVSKIFRFREGNQSDYRYFSTEAKAILYVINKLYQREYDINIEVYHNGFCGKCSKQLETKLEQHYGLDFHCVGLVDTPVQINHNK